jgi:Zn-dependent protease with chaperone function
MSIIAHEMGHVAKVHMPWMIFANSLQNTLFLIIFIIIGNGAANGTNNFYASFGWNTYRDNSPYIAALLADEISNLFVSFTQMLKLRIVRECEYEADQFVHENTHYGKDLTDSLICLFIRD